MSYWIMGIMAALMGLVGLARLTGLAACRNRNRA